MSEDNVIQFVPKPNPSRVDVPGVNLIWPMEWISKEEALKRWPAADTAPSEYVAPTDDCA